MKLSLTLFILLFVSLLIHSCRDVRRDISSIDELFLGEAHTFSAKITTLRNNGKRITISGGCENGVKVSFSSEFLVRGDSKTVDCEDGFYEKKLFFQDDIEGRMWVQVRHLNQSIDVLVPFVDTKNPSRVILTSPVPGYRYGNSIFFSGRCEPGAKVFIRSSYLDSVLRTVGCANGVFISSVYLKDSIADESQIIFSLYQVDPYGNSSSPIRINVEYQNIMNSITLDEQMIPLGDEEASISGSCGEFDFISIEGEQVACENKRFKYVFDKYLVGQGKNRSFRIVVVEGLKTNGARSNAKIAIVYNQLFETNPRFYSPTGTYDIRERKKLVVSGTCGKTYFKGSVRLYTAKNPNILNSGETIPLNIDGSFYVKSNEFSLKGEERIYAECRDFYIKYKTNNFYTDFNFVDTSDINRFKKDLFFETPTISLIGNCLRKGRVVITNTRDGKTMKSDCVGGEVQFIFESSRLWGKDVFEVYEEDVFEDLKSEKQLFTINYNIFPNYPSRLYIEAPSPLWGSLYHDIILYWNYGPGDVGGETDYGIYSRDSYIQAQWKEIPRGTRNIIIRGRDLVKLGYEECSQVQLFLKVQNRNKDRAVIVESKGFYFDFTPPQPIEVLDVDYSPLFNKMLPEFKISEVDDNCSDYIKHDWLKGIQWYEVRLYKIDLIKSNIDLIDEMFLFELSDINKAQRVFDLKGVYQIGIVAVDMGLNRSKEYRSIMFSWN